MQRIRERFAGHGLADLVAEILRAEGYHCTVSTPGGLMVGSTSTRAVGPSCSQR